jgi:DNA helicase-2/ATP-dependent DNA helicase PcrA
MAAGNLDLRALLNVNHLIVDEFQDLNPMDLEFVNALVNTGTKILVAGDDDQSVYSFRFA